MKALADTGFIVAFLNRRDQHHRWAISLAQEITEPWVTCDAVLAEAIFHTGSAGAVFDLIQDGMIVPAFEVASRMDRLRILAKRYTDRKPDMADLCLICLSETHPRLPVATVDTDFRIYRRFQREAIPVLMP